MMKKINKLLPFLFFTILLISMIIFTDKVIISVKTSLEICINNVIPTMFPFLIISSILTNYGFIELVSKLMHPIMKYIFHLNSNCAYVLLLSMLSGSPTNAKYIKQLLDNKKITIKDANKILLFSHFINPIFIIGTVGIIFLNNKKYGYLILISHILSNLIIGIFLRDKSIPLDKEINIIKYNSKTFFIALKDAIKDAVNTLVIVFGTITSMLVFLNIINSYFNFNHIFYGIIEITCGLKYLSSSSLKVFYKIIISTFFLSFGGISIHTQVLSIIDNKKIRYIPYLEARIIQGLLSVSIVIILLIII